MAPTYPWGKKKQQTNTSSPGLPGSKPDGQKSQYEEIQEDELIALSSIYGEDFRQIEKNQVAWKVYYWTYDLFLK
jgi:translation initiation factor 2-alpha kinase 4